MAIFMSKLLVYQAGYLLDLCGWKIRGKQSNWLVCYLPRLIAGGEETTQEQRIFQARRESIPT